MTAMLAIARRETAAFFASPLGWIVLLAFLFVNGFFFSMVMGGYYSQYSEAMFNPDQIDQMNVNDWVVQPSFNFFSIIAVFLSPAISMRLIAEDRRQKSIDLLLTSPVTSLQIVLGKFLGALGFVLALCLGTGPFVGMLYALGEPDTGIVLCNYASYFLILATLVAAGLAFSAFTENQIVALVLSFGFNISLWIFGFLTSILPEGDYKEAVNGYALLSHAETMGKGVLHSTDFVYFFSFIGLSLFVATQRVEALRWR
jgi:ABC-2 type transport system permease protein